MRELAGLDKKLTKKKIHTKSRDQKRQEKQKRNPVTTPRPMRSEVKHYYHKLGIGSHTNSVKQVRGHVMMLS